MADYLLYKTFFVKKHTGKDLSMRYPQHLYPLAFLFLTISYFIISIPCKPVFAGSEIVSVKVGAYENYPKIFTDENNKVSGFWPDLLNYIAKKENWKIEYIHGNWSENLAALEREDIDIMPDVAFTEKRNSLYFFSEEPVLMSWARLYVNTNNNDIKSIEDLKNRKIAALRGSSNLESEKGFRVLLQKFNIPCTFIELDSYVEVFQAIDQSRVDAGITNRNFGNKNEFNYDVKKIGVIFNPVILQFAFLRNAHSTPFFANTINFHMAQLVADKDSLYYQLLKKYFEAEIANQKIEVYPDWLNTALLGVTALLGFFILAIFGVKFQVERKTRELKNTNDALRQSEEKYRVLADEAPDIRYRADTEGMVIYISKSVKKLSGYTAEEITGRKITDFYADPAEREALFARLQKDGYVNDFVAQLKRKNGSICWAAANIQFYKDSGGNILGVDGTIRDITDQKQVQIALEQSEQRLQLALEGSDIAIWDWNMQTNDVYCSPRYFSMLGYNYTELPHTLATSENLLHPEDRSSVKQQVRDIIEKGSGSWSLEFRFRTKDGHYKWILGRGKIVEFSQDNTPLRAAGTHLDITSRKETETNLIRAKKEWEKTFDAIADIVTLHDTNLRIVRANKSAMDFLGQSNDELLGRYCYETFFGLQKPCSNCPAISTLRDTKNHGATVEHKELDKIFQISSSPIFDRNNDVQLVVHIAQDITELKQLENQLHQSQKMEAIGLMAGGVAHDLNNILAGIVSYPELLLQQLPESSELRKPIEAIQQSGKRAATVVADLLTVARGAASTRELYDINVLIDEYLCSPEYKNLISCHPGVICTEQLDAYHPIIFCSSMHIKKIVMNLISNAVESIRDKGNVFISTSNQQVETKKDQKQLNIEPGEYVIITVQDDGSGISNTDLVHIFEPFYTKKVMGQSGTGLGLAIVWNSVQDHDGKIFVMSSKTGTRFQVYLPVSAEQAVQVQGENTEDLTGNKEHLLVVDDEPQIRDIATLILQELGYRVDSVSSGELAIQYVKDNPVDLLVIDMSMEPGINGRQTYEEILKLYPEQKAIVASGFSETNDVKATLQLGANGFIQKPYSIDQLALAVKEALIP